VGFGGEREVVGVTRLLSRAEGHVDCRSPYMVVGAKRSKARIRIWVTGIEIIQS